MQISSYWNRSKPIAIDLAPEREVTEALRARNDARNLAAARTALRAALPVRLADRWLELHAPESWTNRALDKLERQAHHWEITPEGTEGYEKAEVTAGGVTLDEVDSRTLQSRRAPGLFLAGEVLDLDGPIGGYNFQAAWSTGWLAGSVIARTS